MIDSIRTKLLSSSSYASFWSEAVVRDAIASKGWSATQGAIYKDVRGEKLREIDVLAHRAWKSEREDIRVTVVLAVECKTMRGFHLIVNPTSPAFLKFQSCDLSSWLGFAGSKDRRALYQVLRKNRYNNDKIIKVSKRVDAVCYPDETAIISPFLIEPNPVETVFHAWRETNIGTEKEIDLSVFWRAGQVLDSCVESLQNWRVTNLKSDIRGDIEMHEKAGWGRLECLDETLQRYSRQVWLYHPVVVTDAQLWKTSSKEIESISVARYVRSTGFQQANRWFDVVSSEQVEGYISELTDYYVRSFGKSGGKNA